MSLHPQARAFLASQPVAGPVSTASILRERAEMRAAVPPPEQRPAVDEVVDLDADGVRCRLYRPRAGAPVALYVHGGGWALHDLETHDAFCRHLSVATGWALLAVDYRRAPEHPYPAPLDDVQKAARWLRRSAGSIDVDATWLAAIGDSSDGNLVAGLCVRDPRAVDLQVLVYPVTDRRAVLAEPSPSMEWYWDAYAPGDVADLPDVSPARADLRGLPPAVVVTAEHDGLRDQGEAYAAALAEAGVEVVGHRALGMIHGFWRLPEVFDASHATVAMVAGLLHARWPAARDGRLER